MHIDALFVLHQLVVETFTRLEGNGKEGKFINAHVCIRICTCHMHMGINLIYMANYMYIS